jgi:hypothetical protein
MTDLKNTWCLSALVVKIFEPPRLQDTKIFNPLLVYKNFNLVACVMDISPNAPKITRFLGLFVEVDGEKGELFSFWLLIGDRVPRSR